MSYKHKFPIRTAYDFSPICSSWRRTTGRSSHALAVRQRMLKFVNALFFWSVEANLTYSSKPFLIKAADSFSTPTSTTASCHSLQMQIDIWSIIPRVIRRTCLNTISRSNCGDPSAVLYSELLREMPESKAWDFFKKHISRILWSEVENLPESVN